MLDFQCPSCRAKCSVDEQFRGRKLRCPKCGTRIRHHLDGTIELLSVGESPGAPAAATPPAAWQAMSESPKAESPPPPAPAAEVVPPPSAPAPLPTTGLVTKLTRKSESQQNTIVMVGIGAAIVGVIALVGLLTQDLKLSAAALAIGFGVAYAALYLRSKRRQAREPVAPPAPRPAAPPVGDDKPTEPLAKV